MRGPIDYIIVGFEGNKFDGSVLNALNTAIDNGTIKLISLAVISKDTDGSVSELDINKLKDEYAVHFTSEYIQDNNHIDDDDLNEVADLLQPDTSAGLLIIEHLWAKPLKEAIIDSNGTLLAEGRIHPEAALELERNKE